MQDAASLTVKDFETFENVDTREDPSVIGNVTTVENLQFQLQGNLGDVSITVPGYEIIVESGAAGEGTGDGINAPPQQQLEDRLGHVPIGTLN